jgi:hypothetical protein
MAMSRAEMMAGAALVLSAMSLAAAGTGAQAASTPVRVVASAKLCAAVKVGQCGYLAPASVTTTAIASNAVTDAKIKPNAVTSTDIAPGAVSSLQVKDGSLGPTDVGVARMKPASVVADSKDIVLPANSGTGELVLGSGGTPAAGSANFQTAAQYVPPLMEFSSWTPCQTSGLTAGDPTGWACVRVPNTGIYTVQVDWTTYGGFDGTRNIGVLVAGYDHLTRKDSFNPANGFRAFNAGLIPATSLGTFTRLGADTGAFQTVTKGVRLTAGQAVMVALVWQHTLVDHTADVHLAITAVG